MSEIDPLVSRTIDTVSMIAETVTRFARKLLIGVLIICVGGFLLGVTALDGTARTIWIALAGVFGAIAIGGPLLAIWRVGSVKRHVPELVDEIRSLVSSGHETGRTVIEVFDVDHPDRPSNGQSAMVLTRQVYGLRGAVGSGLEGSARLTAAVTALTSFPGLVLAAIGITFVFGFLSLIFLIALAF